MAVEPGQGLGTAAVAVRITGARVGREVVQVYVDPAVADPGRPIRWLAGFASVEAGPGQTATVHIPLPERTAQIWDDGWRAVPGPYLVEAGRSVADRRLTVTVEWP